MDIAKEIGPVTNIIYQSTRGGLFDLPAVHLPENGVRVGEIASIELQEGNHRKNGSINGNDEPLPLTLHLKSGQKLCGIHRIILCTGYHMTLPFLGQYHQDYTRPDDASETVLVTDGTMVHNLYYDIFYIPDPTLAFVGIPYYTATFSLFEFQAIVVAAVFSGVARLPSQAEMRAAYQERVRQQGSGKRFHSLRDKEEFYVQDVLGWVNRDRAAGGLPPIEGHSEAWLAKKESLRERIRSLFADDGSAKDEDSTLPATC